LLGFYPEPGFGELDQLQIIAEALEVADQKGPTSVGLLVRSRLWDELDEELRRGQRHPRRIRLGAD
jgi:hypothetical protein